MIKDEFPKWPNTQPSGEKRAEAQRHYNRQSEIIRQTLNTANPSLNTLIDLMRTRGEAAMYLAGTRLDSDFCFGSNDVGLVISALPHDGVKASKPGYHPGSTEVYVVFSRFFGDGTSRWQPSSNSGLWTVRCCHYPAWAMSSGSK